jgi:hypothetical protein
MSKCHTAFRSPCECTSKAIKIIESRIITPRTLEEVTAELADLLGPEVAYDLLAHLRRLGYAPNH